MKMILGLPLKTATFYFIAFAMAFSTYCFIWPQAPIVAGDSKEYLGLAADLKNGTINVAHDRLLGYIIDCNLHTGIQDWRWDHIRYYIS